MARKLIFTLVVLAVIVAASAAPAPPKKKDPGHLIATGRVLCKQGNKPISGATVLLNCTGAPNGDKPRQVVTIISNPTDGKGQYTIGVEATLPTGEKLIHCRVSLKSSPLKNCNVPTNTNSGIKGFGLTKVERTTNPKDKLFFVPDFFYTK